jgi:hypothetical protein
MVPSEKLKDNGPNQEAGPDYHQTLDFQSASLTPAPDKRVEHADDAKNSMNRALLLKEFYDDQNKTNKEAEIANVSED